MWWIISESIWDDKSTITNMYVDENVRRPTGLLTKEGKQIFKEPNEIGFGRKQDIYSIKS